MATSAPEVSQDIGVRDLLEAGLHFGHQTKRWNPKMKRFIFDKRNGIHIIDLSKSLLMLQEALEFVHSVVINGKSVLFVGTKKQAQQVIQNAAADSGQFFVTHRWLGGTLTNNATIRNSIKRMRDIEDLEKKGAFETMHKKEASRLRRELEKLRRNLGGIADMSQLPGAMFVVDINREAIAVKEAVRLGIPVVAIVDTNCDPDPIDFVVPGNDDAIRAIKLIAGAVAETAKRAAAEYAKIAAEIARKKEQEERKAEEARKKAEEERAKLEAEKKAAAEKAAAERAAKEKAAKEKAAEKRAAKKKAAEEKADQEKPVTEGEEAPPAEDGDAKKAAAKAPAKKAAKKKTAKKAAKKADEEPADKAKAEEAPKAPADSPAEAPVEAEAKAEEPKEAPAETDETKSE